MTKPDVHETGGQCDTIVSRLRVSFKAQFSQMLTPMTLSVWHGSALIAGLSGPFGSYGDKGFVQLFLTWWVLIGVTIFTIYTVYAIWAVFSPVRETTRFYFAFIPVTAVICGGVLDLLLRYGLQGPFGSNPNQVRLTLEIGAIMCIVVLVRRYMEHLQAPLAPRDRAMPSAGGDVASDGAPHSRLAQRLGLPRGARIERIAASGHFIEVFSQGQSHRIRLRFSDALRELDGIEGLCTHRSHWVNRDAIRGWRQSGPKPVVVLHDGQTVPVSKTYLADVQAAQLTELD